MVSDRPSAWLFGLASHLANSVLLVLLWAMVIVPNLAWPRILTGLAWGVVVAIIRPAENPIVERAGSISQVVRVLGCGCIRAAIGYLQCLCRTSCAVRGPRRSD
jgi:hypothetical protein